MPGALRARAALFSLMAAFLIPVATGGLRGLTHVLTCEDSVESPFTIVVREGQAPQLLSSTRIERGGPDQGVLCDALRLQLKAKQSASNDRIPMEVVLENITDKDWQGTIHLQLSGQSAATFPVGIGSVPAGATRSDTVEITLPQGTTELGGSLLIGP